MNFWNMDLSDLTNHFKGDVKVIGHERTAISHPFGQYIAGLLQLNMKTGPWLAGGMLQKLYHTYQPGLSDWDLWFANVAQFNSAYSSLMALDSKPIKTLNAVTFNIKWREEKYKVQLIKTEYFNCADDVIDKFDFTVCQMITDGFSMKVGEHTIADLKSKTLRLTENAVKEGIGTRMIKYMVYGYMPSVNTVNQIQQTDSSKWATKNGEY